MRSVVCAAAVLLAIPAFANDPSAVRALNVKNVKLALLEPNDPMHRLIVITTVEELERSTAFADDASRAEVQKHVDFSKEKVVVVAWRGSSSESVHVKLSKDGKTVSFPIVTPWLAKADLHSHVAMFAVPTDMTIASDLDLLKMSLQDVKIDFSKGGYERKPLVIKSADELAKVEVFADEASRATIQKRVDFSKDKLVVFVWSGSGQDKLAGVLSQDGKTAVFTYTAGLTDDLRHHAHVFVLPKDCEVKMGK